MRPWLRLGRALLCFALRCAEYTFAELARKLESVR